MTEKADKKLCKLTKKKYLKTNLKEFTELIKNPKFVCLKCGRVAKDKKYLCKPVIIDQ